MVEFGEGVSTHGRTEAAAKTSSRLAFLIFSFNTQPHGGGCPNCLRRDNHSCGFNTQPHGGGCTLNDVWRIKRGKFQHTAARRRLPFRENNNYTVTSFNTQPHGGGCFVFSNAWGSVTSFQHTAARRRLPQSSQPQAAEQEVSTHSRTEAAASAVKFPFAILDVSTHSRPKATAQPAHWHPTTWEVSTHSRPKATASCLVKKRLCANRFNTQPPEGDCRHLTNLGSTKKVVSTHSRPKATAPSANSMTCTSGVSTHSRPKATAPSSISSSNHSSFQHTAARRRLLPI